MISALPGLQRYALALTGQRQPAEDLLQDCVERALRKRLLFRGGNLAAWLTRMMLRLYLNQRAQHRRRPTEVDLDACLEPLGAGAEATLGLQTLGLQVRETVEALYRLPAEQRATLLLVVLDGLSYQEAAGILGVRLGTVRSRIARAREALRLALEAPDRAEIVAIKRLP